MPELLPLYTKEDAQQKGARCEECPLAVGGIFVPSVGPKDAKVAFVGEAPGQQEARQGTPFVGPSGRLLEKVMAQNGIERKDVFLSNACLCRPADGSTPPNLAIQACRPRLHHELKEAGVGTVVAMGNSACLGVLGVQGVTKLRVGPGRDSTYEDLRGVRIIPTVHPAACLRQSDMFPSLVADVRKVIASYGAWTDPIVEVIDTVPEAIRFAEDLQRRGGDVVIDIEVDIDKDTSFDHPNRYGLLCIGHAWEPDRAVVLGERVLGDPDVRSALDKAYAECSLDMQNGKFDSAGLQPVLGTAHPVSFDTLLASYCLDERPGIHSLDFQAVEVLGAPQWKDEIKKYVKGTTLPELDHYAGYGRIPRPKLYKYCGFDVIATYRLKQLRVKQLETKQPTWWGEDLELSNGHAVNLFHYQFRNLRYLHDFLVEASNEIMFLELNGITVDRDYAGTLTEMYMESLGKLEDGIDNILAEAKFKSVNPRAGALLNPRSPQQVMKALNYFRVKADSTDEDTLKEIVEQCKTRSWEDKPLYKFCVELLKHRRESKLYGTYVKGTIKRLYRGRVYPTFLLHGTTTGRPSCRNPNLQNVPRESAIKGLFIPAGAGRLFVQADFSQAELRVLSWLAQDNYFRDILNDPTRDLFDELTPILYPELPSKEETPPELWKETRIRVKAFVYGLGYGRTEFSIAYEYNLSVQEAKKVKARFFSTIPEIVDWQTAVKKHVWSGKDLISPFGRHRRFHLITDDNWKSIQNEALAFLPQSTSSDICLRAMVRVRRDLRGSGAFVRNIVHDSILVDSPADMANDVAALLDHRMVESAHELVGDYVEFRTDCKIGNNWGEV